MLGQQLPAHAAPRTLAAHALTEDAEKLAALVTSHRRNYTSPCGMNLKVLQNVEPQTDLPWYGGGLRFTCTQCGNCCTGQPGYVWISKKEIRGYVALLIDIPSLDELRLLIADFIKNATATTPSRGSKP